MSNGKININNTNYGDENLIDEETKKQLMLRLEASKTKPDVFCPLRLFELFTKSLRQENNVQDIGIKEYVQAYDEINKFLDYLGKVFYFVVSDIKEKMEILNQFAEKDLKNYETVLKAVEYEKNNKIIETNKNNAARTLLRLHRALLFIYKFLEKLFKSDEIKSSSICIECYDNTLAKHHSWVVKKAARLGMHTLPKREVLFSYMVQEPEDTKYFPFFIQRIETVYNITQAIYEKYQLLDLP